MLCTANASTKALRTNPWSCLFKIKAADQEADVALLLLPELVFCHILPMQRQACQSLLPLGAWRSLSVSEASKALAAASSPGAAICGGCIHTFHHEATGKHGICGIMTNLWLPRSAFSNEMLPTHVALALGLLQSAHGFRSHNAVLVGVQTCLTNACSKEVLCQANMAMKHVQTQTSNITKPGIQIESPQINKNQQKNTFT